MRCVHVAAAIAALLLVAVSLPGEEKNGKGWISLFNGKDTTGWKLRADKIKITKIVDPDGKDIAGTKRVNKDGKTIIVDKNGEEIKDAKVVEMTVDNPSGWTVEKEELISSKPHHGNDLLTDQKFTDFALHVEFQATSNSGVYLQGRYEIQINNDEKAKPKLVEKDGKQLEVWDTHICGAIYGRIAPSKNMCKPPMEWQTYDVVFHGAQGEKGKVTKKARVTLVWNGEKVIDDAEIEGTTGGALDSNVTEPGPILLQGDHGRVAFRNIKIKPLTAK